MANDAAQLDTANTTPTVAVPGALRLRTVKPSDGEAIHALLAANIPGILGDRGRWLRRWQWQYWTNPFRGGRPAGWVLTDEEQIAGHLGAVYVPFRVGLEHAPGMIGADYAVSADALARGGIFAGLQLAKAFFDAATGTIPMATTANDKTAAVFTRFGCSSVAWTQEFWRAPVTIAQQIRACRGATSRIARKLLRQPGGSAIAHVAGQFYRATRSRPAIPLPSGCRLEITTPRLASDISRVADQSFRVGIDRCADYFDWRYNQHPERANIRVITLRRDDASPVAGAFIFLEDRGPERLAFIEDLIVPADRPDAVRALLCAALQLAADNDADTLITMTGRHELRGVYWELGFESRARSALAAVIRYEAAQPPTGSGGTPALDAHLELWHGAMF